MNDTCDFKECPATAIRTFLYRPNATSVKGTLRFCGHHGRIVAEELPLLTWSESYDYV